MKSVGRHSLSLVVPSRKLSAGGEVIDSCRFTERVNNELEEEIVNAFDPNALPIKIWHQVLLLCLFYELFMIPYFLGFGIDFTTVLYEWMLVFFAEFLFVLDFYVQANTGYYEDGDVIRDKKKTRRKYFKSYGFVLDVFAIIPFASIGIKTYLPIALLYMNKLIRYWRMGKYVATLDEIYAKYFALVKLLKVVVLTFYMSHFVACVRFWFGYNISDEHDEWLPEIPVDELSAEKKYLKSFFWAFGLLSGLFEGELPYTIPEFVFTIGVATCGFSLFTILCAMFFMISKCESTQTEIVEARINQLKHLLSFHRVPDHLQAQAIDYLRVSNTHQQLSFVFLKRGLWLCFSATVQMMIPVTVRL